MTGSRTPRAPATPLLGDTIGAQPATGRSPRSPTARRWSTCRPAAAGPTREFADDVDAVARGLLRPRRRQGRPGRDLGAQLRRVGARPVRHRAARRDPGQHQPRVPAARAGVRPEAGGRPAAGRRRRSQDERLRGDGRARSAARCPELRDVVLIGDPDWDALVAEGRERRPRPSSPRSAATLGCDDPINIQYTSGTTGFPKGATLLPPQHPQQRLLRRRARSATPKQDRVCVPVPFYHCFGMVMGNLGGHLARRLHRDPGARLRPGGDAARRSRHERCTSLYGVPTMFIAELASPTSRSYDLACSLRTGIMAGSPCPVEVMKRVIERDGHGRGLDLLRHDRDLAGVDADPRGRRPRAPRVDGRDRSCPHLEVKVVDPATGRDGPARRARRAVHPRLLGDARLLGGAGEDRGGHRRGPAGCTPATSR